MDEKAEVEVVNVTMESNQPARDALGENPATGHVIYVVDDEPIVGEVVEILLNKAGYRPKLFQDPMVALMDFRAANPKPSLLLTDYDMGSMNGMELIERCKRIQPDLKTILFSGNVDESIISYYSVAPDGFASKPFRTKALIDTVRFLIEEGQ